MLVGVVVKNKNNKFLILKRMVGDQIDLSLIGGEVEKENPTSSISELLIAETGVDFYQETQPIMSGVDIDGEYLILYSEKELEAEKFFKVQADELLWLSFSQVKKLYEEGRLNYDQFLIIEKALKFRKNTKNSNAMRESHLERKYQKLLDRDDFAHYVERYDDERLVLRLAHGRKIKPCGRECREYGYLIASTNDHKSFENFPELMNDKEFIIEIARLSPNPVECENYFYNFVNPHLKRDCGFRLEVLKAIYLNDNVYKLEDINAIVQAFGFEKENETILADINFKRAIEKRLEDIDYRDRIQYSCSGEDEKELHEYKVNANEMKILCENMKIGLKGILETFTVGKKEEAEDFYSFLCSTIIN